MGTTGGKGVASVIDCNHSLIPGTRAVIRASEHRLSVPGVLCNVWISADINVSVRLYRAYWQRLQ
jgi:hypothetical protein